MNHSLIMLLDFLVNFSQMIDEGFDNGGSLVTLILFVSSIVMKILLPFWSQLSGQPPKSIEVPPSLWFSGYRTDKSKGIEFNLIAQWQSTHKIVIAAYVNGPSYEETRRGMFQM